MKVTADGILGSARNINSRRKDEETARVKETGSVKSDSLDLGRVINSRIEALGKEVKEIQNSLTKNQIIRDGIDKLRSDAAGGETGRILNETTFNGNRVLMEFVGSAVSRDELGKRYADVKALIAEDVNSLTRLQVEMDNIAASGISGDKKVDTLMAGVAETLNNAPSGMENISNLDAARVMKLIR